MRRSEYDENPSAIHCPRENCGSNDTCINNHLAHPGGGVYCKKCGRFIQWLSKDNGRPHRERLKAGTLDRVWTSWGDRCANCGILRADLPYIRAYATVQHAPPYSVVGNDAWLIPYCSWCQEDSARALRRMKALTEKEAAIGQPAA